MGLVDQIRAEILSGRYPPGALLSQTELAAAHGVSRIPVRDALQGLASEKLVEVIPGKGARVIRLSAADLDEIRDLRVMLECDLLERSIARADAAARAEVEYALRKSSIEAGRPGWRSGDWLFHRTLYLPAGRPRQLAMVEELRTGCALYVSGYDDLVVETERWLADHAAIARAFIAGKADKACAVLRRHILAAHAHLEALNRPRRQGA